MVNDFLFADEVEDNSKEDEGKWKILIVDDEPEVHAVTKLALSDFSFLGKRLEFYSAYSGKEAKELILQHPDTAIVLLDVVMETDDAGLNVARFVREEADNHFVRIILRTGQPGQAPERQVIVNYDINDYKSKTELTAQKLFTVTMASLRSYRDILAIEQNRQGLVKIIEASADLFSIHSLEGFIEGIMQQLTSIIGGTEQAMYVTSLVASNSDKLSKNDLVVFAAQGDFAQKEGQKVADILPDNMVTAFEQAMESRSIVYGEDFLVAYCASQLTTGSLLYVSGLPHSLENDDKNLIELFSQNVQVAFENILLQSELEDTQREIVYRLSDAVETRSQETGNHVKRVAEYCKVMATHYGLPDAESDRLRLASPLHDVGKIGIPDAILNKPGGLEPDEWETMKQHAQMGYNLLSGSSQSIIQAGALIARDHHEKWDGTGYPDGKKGEEIHLYGRIVALADVYDALRNSRCYKPAWEKDKVVKLITEQSGKHFDPKLVEIFIQNIDQFETILARYPES